jgi:hypothetical protein
MKHFILPDVQAKPGQDFTFLRKIGEYVIEKQPEKIICLGDFADMPSLSSYDVGKKSFEGRRYTLDIQAATDAMEAFLAPIVNYNFKAKKNKEKQYKPEMHLTLGNHEQRIERAINNDPKLDGLISYSDLDYEGWGWKVYPFLDVVVIDGIAYSHYFTSGLMGRPATSANAQLNKTHMSCISGHQQGLQIATGKTGEGKLIHSIIAGSCYEHDEDYLGRQGNNHWRGALMLNDVNNGDFDIMPLRLKYLVERK